MHLDKLLWKKRYFVLVRDGVRADRAAARQIRASAGAMAISKVAPAPGLFPDTNGFAKFTEIQTYFSENSVLRSTISAIVTSYDTRL